MKIKVALAAGFLLVAFLSFGLSQDVPDEAVYTEGQKTLVLGATGILRCRFKGAPNAVYWKKGNDLASAQTVMIWVYGQERGPSHEDGSYDIDGNFSLVIKNVKNSDAGRYICRISNYKGFLIHNYTDVTITVDALETRSVVFMKKGSSGALPCRIKIRPKAISWKKGTSYSTATTLVKMDTSDDVEKKTWPGFQKNSMDILEDSALLIKDAKIQDEGYYFCEVIDFDTGTPFWDSTIVNVTAEPRHPYPCMEQCPREQQCPSFCTLRTNPPVTLECSVSAYYPSITLTFLRETEIIDSSTVIESINTDGTKNKKITIVATNENSYYECVASHVPGSGGNSSKLIHVIVGGSKAVAIAVPGMVVLVCCTTFLIFCWKRRSRKRTSRRTVHRTEEVTLGKYDRVSTSEEIEQVPDDMKKGPLSENELKSFVRGVSGTHCQVLVHSLQSDKTMKLDSIIEENEASLFATRRMIEEWWSKQDCAPYEKRCKLLEATSVSRMKGHGNKHLDAWPSNKELKQIAANVDTAFCRKLDSTCQDADTEEKRLETMCKWRNMKHRQKLTDIHGDLHSALGEMKLEGLLPVLKTILLYKTEIIDMAYSLIKEDLIPFARALGIEEANFRTYQQPFQPANLKVGTLGVLSNFLGQFDTIPEMRCTLCKTLEEAGYFSIARCAIFACEPSFGELFSIEAAVHAEEEERYQTNLQSTPRTDEDVSGLDPAPVRDTNVMQKVTDPDPSKQEIQEAANTSNIVAQDVASPALSEDCKQNEIQKKVVNDLMTMLKLSDQEMNGNTVPSDPIGTLKMFKTWKEKLRMQQVDHRASLYEGLQSINRHKIAAKFIAGTYRSSGGTSLVFIQDMVQRMEKGQLKKLGKLLKLKGTEEQMSLKIKDWMQGWISEMDSSALDSLKPVKGVSPMNDLASIHKRFNDELVDNGFLDLAREIMNIEQQI